MNTKQFTNSQYDALATCPFCDDIGLTPSGDDCGHFVTAFQDGAWDPDLCPPVFCNGFRYRREPLERTLALLPGVLCKLKPITETHPNIVAYFCADPENAAHLRDRFRRTVISNATHCRDCGNGSAVFVEEDNEIVCAVCGGTTELVNGLSMLPAGGFGKPS